MDTSRTRPAASIVIVGYGKRAVTEACLRSLDRALGADLGDRFELVLVDNNSPDDTLDLFEAWSDRARVVALPENRNFSGGCNAGAEAAEGDVLIFLNNDTEVPAGALETLVEQAAEPGVGIVGARLLYPTGRIQHAGVTFRFDNGTAWPMHLFHHEPGDLAAARATYDLDATTGACLVIGRDLFAALGGFDETYVNGLEDIDLCLRARVAGNRVVYRGDVSIVHHERLTRGAGHDESANAVLFFKRWREVCDGDEELLAQTFGAGFAGPEAIAYPQDMPGETPIVFGGAVTTVSPEAAEARALLSLAAEAGLDPALRDAPHPSTGLCPLLHAAPWELIKAARRRVADPDATRVHVPAGARWEPGSGGAVVRVGQLPASVSHEWGALVAPSQNLARRLVDSGVDPDKVHVLHPPVAPLPLGGGGEGLLVLLPGHDLARSARVIAAVADLLPAAFHANVRTPALEALVAEHCPSAELSQPLLDELAFAQLAGRHDAVLCAADEDPFERRALIAAASGAAIVARADGPAAEVLPDAPVVAAGLHADDLRTATTAALGEATPRGSRAALVAAACGPDALGRRLAAILERHRALPQGFTLAEMALERVAKEPLA